MTKWEYRAAAKPHRQESCVIEEVGDRAEYHNDRRLVIMTLAFGTVGALYGVQTSSSTLGAIVSAALYGFVGMCIGVVLAFAINLLKFRR